MKKVLLIAVAGMFVLTSCKKDWTCDCKIEYGSAKQNFALPLTNQTKSSATTQCDAAQTNYSSIYGAMNGTVKCDLK